MRSGTSPTEWTAIGEITWGDHNAADGDDAWRLPALDQFRIPDTPTFPVRRFGMSRKKLGRWRNSLGVPSFQLDRCSKKLRAPSAKLDTSRKSPCPTEYAKRAPPAAPRFCSGCSESAGHNGPLLYPRPLCGGKPGATGRAAGDDMDVDSFSSGQATARMLELRKRRSSFPMTGKRQAGWPSVLLRAGLAVRAAAAAQWLLISWPRKRQVTRATQAHEALASAKKAACGTGSCQ